MSSDCLRSYSKDVQDAEHSAIARRADSDGIAGLAISGGGIRSATFALGLLESLKACGLLSKVHYLSTVSGGGYIGAWLSANCRRRADWLTSDWTDSIRHLRRYSNYLSPQLGFFSADTWSIITIWLRNTILIQATVILAIACALLAPRPLFWVFHNFPDGRSARWATVVLFIFGIVGIAGNHWQLTTPRFSLENADRQRRWRAVELLQARAWKIGAAAALGLFTAALVAIWSFHFDPFAVYDVTASDQTMRLAVARSLEAVLIGGLLVLSGFCLQPVAVKVVAAISPARPQQVNYTQGYVQCCVVTPLMIVALLVTSILWAQATGHPKVTSLKSLTTYSALVTQAWRFWPFHLSIVFVSFWLLSFFAISSRREPRRILIALIAPAVAVPALHALLAAIVLIFQQFNRHVGGEWMAFVWGPPLVAMAFVLAIVVLLGMLGRDSTDGVREWWSRLGAWLAIYAAAWMVIVVSAVYGPKWMRWAASAVTDAPWKALTGLTGWAATVAGGLMAGNSPSTGGGAEGVGAKAKDLLARIAPFVFIAGVLLAVAFVLHVIINLNGGTDWWVQSGEPLVAVPLVMLAATLAATILLAARVDLNEFSLNAFYRNRLVRCYLGATRDEAARNPQNFTGFDDKDDMPLAVADPAVLNGPLHIVNCALNLGGSSDLALHTRHSASFTLSPLHCGSAYLSHDQQGQAEELGFVTTSQFGHQSGGPTLGQAIAVSGAAASPNMGYHTSSVIAFLMTLFNIRLGWWFPNPRDTAGGAMSPHFSLSYLAAELFGGASDKTSFLMVSDGGHFENLAAYELIRRRCGVIVVSDCECDGDYTFGGLGTLIRMCEVDFGCRIAIDVDDLRPGTGPEGWSTRRFAIGDITYRDGSTAILIYLKASMAGKEDTSVRQYKSSHPTFPHESTGDQFYGEDQFESYRHLGRDIGFEVFGPLTGEPSLASAALKLRSAQRQG
ncbi:MAG: hypothetical protein ABI868_05035 [Acidobacteriota bacterium]